MTPGEVRKRVMAIAACTDPEEAHSHEDDLLTEVLAAIAAGAEEPRLLAAAALVVTQQDRPRWYA